MFHMKLHPTTYTKPNTFITNPHVSRTIHSTWTSCIVRCTIFMICLCLWCLWDGGQKITLFYIQFKTEAEFLDVIGTKVSSVCLLALHSQVWIFSRLCPETSMKVYVHEFGFWASRKWGRVKTSRSGGSHPLNTLKNLNLKGTGSRDRFKILRQKGIVLG